MVYKDLGKEAGMEDNCHSYHGSAPWARADFLLLGSSKEDGIQLTWLL